MITIINKFDDCNSKTKLIDLFHKHLELNPYNKIAEDRNKVNLFSCLIPVDLIDDIKYVIEKNYNNDYLRYFNEVSLYFETFTYEDLTFCNTFHNSLYNSPEADRAMRRYLKRERKGRIFHAAALLKIVGKGASYYCPRALFSEYKYNKKCEQEFIKNSSIVSTEGKIIPLVLATKNSTQKEAELINIIKTIELIAQKKGWTWAFITLTLSDDENGESYHANPLNGSKNYNGVSPKNSAKILNRKIIELRKMLAKNGINPGEHYIGCNSAESHKGGIMHKHMIFFTHANNLKIVKDCFFKKFPNLAMNEEKSFSIEDLSKPLKKENEEYVKGKFRSTATHYVFKYLMKSVSAFDPDLNYDNIKHHFYKKGEEHLLTAEQQKDNLTYAIVINSAFRSFNSIRGFSFFGIENCLTKFRFLARNLEKCNLPEIFKQLVKDNNLYKLITEKYFDSVENIYVKTDKGQKFVGCSINCVKVLKNFFAMVKTAVAEKANDMCKEIALMTEIDTLEKLGLCSKLNFDFLGVLIQNHTRRAKAFEKPTAKEKNDWLEWVKNNPPIEYS